MSLRDDLVDPSALERQSLPARFRDAAMALGDCAAQEVRRGPQPDSDRVREERITAMWSVLHELGLEDRIARALPRMMLHAMEGCAEAMRKR